MPRFQKLKELDSIQSIHFHLYKLKGHQDNILLIFHFCKNDHIMKMKEEQKKKFSQLFYQNYQFIFYQATILKIYTGKTKDEVLQLKNHI